MFSHVTDQFVKAAMVEVRKSFTPGHELLYIPQTKDSSFEWDANRISGTQFIAGQGPKRPNEMTAFLKDTVFHPLFPVSQIVALGNCLGDYSSIDFCDYPVKGFSTLEGYKVDIIKITGEFPLTESLLSVTHPDTSEVRELRVTLFGLEDNDSFCLGGETDEVLKKVLSELIQRSFTERMFVHCKSGYGRTGHFIAMAEIVREYEKIFASPDLKVVASNILTVVKRIRENRPYLLLATEQLNNAVRNATMLYQAKGLLNTASVIERLRCLAKEREPEEKKPTPDLSNQSNPDVFRTENAPRATLFDSADSSQVPAQTQTPAPQFSAPTPRAG